MMNFGPSLVYNSYGDERVSLEMINLGAASTFPVPGRIEFSITGRGPIIGKGSRVAEGVAALFAVASIAVGGPSSMLVKIGTNSVSLNFHCYNRERGYPLSLLAAPVSIEVSGSLKLGAAVFNALFAAAGAGLHMVIVLMIKRQKNCNLVKAQADVAFPSLSFCILAVLVPGYLATSWQGATEVTNLGYLVAVICATAVFILIPFIWLLRRLYGEHAVHAVYTPNSSEINEKLNNTSPLLSLVLARGVWVSTDRHRVFTRRFFFFISEYREDCSHWYCAELSEAIAFGIISSFVNDVPLVCMTQLIGMITVKMFLLLATAYYKPYNSAVGTTATISIHFLQCVALIVLLVDAINGGTRAYSAIAAVLLTLATFALMIISLVTAGVNSYVRFLRWNHSKEMERIAHLFQKHGLMRAEIDEDEDEEELVAMQDQPVTSAFAGSPKAPGEREGVSPVSSEGLPPTPRARSPLRGKQAQQQQDVKDNQSSVTYMSFVAASFAHLPIQQPSGVNGTRDFWRIMAMEELGAAPAGDIARPQADEKDDLL
jgi:hypothetical protein